MGTVPTDEIAGLVIAEDPGYPVSKKGTAMAGGSVTLAAIKQANHGSSNHKPAGEKMLMHNVSYYDSETPLRSLSLPLLPSLPPSV